MAPSNRASTPSCQSVPEWPVSCASHMSSCARVSGSTLSSSSIESPDPNALVIGSSAHYQPLAQGLRPDVRPVLFDVVNTRRAVRSAVHHLPAGWHVSEGRPQAVLLFAVDQHEEAAVVVVKWVDAQPTLQLIDADASCRTILPGCERCHEVGRRCDLCHVPAFTDRFACGRGKLSEALSYLHGHRPVHLWHGQIERSA